MDITCIQYEGSRPEYIHVHALGNMHKTLYTMGKLQKVYIHLTIITYKTSKDSADEVLVQHL